MRRGARGEAPADGESGRGAASRSAAAQRLPAGKATRAAAGAPAPSSLGAFVAHCRARGLSVTQQRLAIFEALSASRAHPSAEQLHQLVRRSHPSLSLATVYKNLDALRAVGAVSDVNPLHAAGRYEAALPGTGASEPHHHLICTLCLRVCDLPASAVPAPALRPDQAQGFEIHAVRVQVEGVCPECRAAAT